MVKVVGDRVVHYVCLLHSVALPLLYYSVTFEIALVAVVFANDSQALVPVRFSRPPIRHENLILFDCLTVVLAETHSIHLSRLARMLGIWVMISRIDSTDVLLNVQRQLAL